MVNITVKIKDLKMDEVEDGFTKIRPIPLDEDGNPLYKIKDWIALWLKDELFRYYKTGKIELARETTQPIIDEDLFEE